MFIPNLLTPLRTSYIYAPAEEVLWVPGTVSAGIPPATGGGGGTSPATQVPSDLDTLYFTPLQGATYIQSNKLVGATILDADREGTGLILMDTSDENAPQGRQAKLLPDLGRFLFDASNPAGGAETFKILYQKTTL